LGKSAAATVIVALTKHSQLQLMGIDKGDIQSVQIESVFAENNFISVDSAD